MYDIPLSFKVKSHMFWCIEKKLFDEIQFSLTNSEYEIGEDQPWKNKNLTEMRRQEEHCMLTKKGHMIRQRHTFRR